MDKKKERIIELVKAIQEDYAQEFYIYAIPGFLSRNFMAYCSMKQDLEILVKYIKELESEKHSDVLKSSLTYGIISLYGKCFTDASKYKSAKLESKFLFKANPKQLKIHEELMNMRHHFIAHRGETDAEVTVAFMLVAMNGDNSKNQMRYKRLKRTGFSKETLSRIKELCEFITMYLEKKIQQTGEKLKDTLFDSFTPEEISLMLMNNAK